VTFKNKYTPKAEMEYNVAERRYEVHVQTRTGTYLTWHISEDNETLEQHNPRKEEVEKLKADLTKTVQTLQESYEEQLDELRRLRAEDAKRYEHLQDEVLRFRGNFQGGYESYSGHASGSEYNLGQPATASVLGLQRHATDATIPTSGTNTSNSWITTVDDSV